MPDQPIGYRHIADVLRAELTTPGAYPPGTHLGTEKTLSDRFDVNRSTIRAALSVLRLEGLIESRRNTGIRVPSTRVRLVVARAMTDAMDPDRELATLGPWETALRAHGLTGHGRVHLVQQEQATADIAARLHIPEGAPVIARYRNPTIDGVGPAQIQRAWMPYERVKDTALAKPGDILGGVYAYMATQGIYVAEFSEEVTARIGSDPELTVLNRPASSVVMDVWRVTLDTAGVPVEALQIIADASLITFAYHQSLT
jgi:GntR family transcriptional regulator